MTFFIHIFVNSVCTLNYLSAHIKQINDSFSQLFIRTIGLIKQHEQWISVQE